jgi:6-pyruvoyl-tetrahydropterin synthase
MKDENPLENYGTYTKNKLINYILNPNISSDYIDKDLKLDNNVMFSLSDSKNFLNVNNLHPNDYSAYKKIKDSIVSSLKFELINEKFPFYGIKNLLIKFFSSKENLSNLIIPILNCNENLTCHIMETKKVYDLYLKNLENNVFSIFFSFWRDGFQVFKINFIFKNNYLMFF